MGGHLLSFAVFMVIFGYPFVDLLKLENLNFATIEWLILALLEQPSIDQQVPSVVY